MPAMDTYKLTYFSVEAKGELIRFIFAQAGVKYENFRTTFNDWAPLKDSTPFGHLPTLEINSKELLTGSGVIGRYLAEKFGLAGNNDIENVKIAAIKDFQDEINLPMVQAFFEKDEQKKKEREMELIEKKIPNHLKLLEKAVKRNPAGGFWLFGPVVTYVDLHIFLIIDFMKLFMKDAGFLDQYPGMKKIYEEVGALPNIAEYIKNRPERTFGPPVA